MHARNFIAGLRREASDRSLRTSTEFWLHRISHICCGARVRFWPVSTICRDVSFVCCWGFSGLAADIANGDAIGPKCMVRPCAARVLVKIAVSGLASMYPAFDCVCQFSGPSWIRARAISLVDRPRPGHLGHQCSQCAGKTEPPSLLILSQTSAG